MNAQEERSLKNIISEWDRLTKLELQIKGITNLDLEEIRNLLMQGYTLKKEV